MKSNSTHFAKVFFLFAFSVFANTSLAALYGAPTPVSLTANPGFSDAATVNLGGLNGKQYASMSVSNPPHGSLTYQLVGCREAADYGALNGCILSVDFMPSAPVTITDTISIRYKEADDGSGTNATDQT